MKKKILFLSPLPEPHYGSALSSRLCLEILKGNNNFEIRNIKLNYSKEISDVGRLNLKKIRGFFKVMSNIRKTLIKFRPDQVYFVPATSGLGLLRDFYFVKQIKKYWEGKIIFHIRSRILKEDWDSKFNGKKLFKMLKGQKVIILGRGLIKDLNGIIVKRDIFILPNTIKNEVSKEQFEKIRIKRFKNKGLKIIFLSNMDRSKGWPKLLNACKLLNENKIDFECVFVGPWRLKKDKIAFKKYILKNNLEEKVFSVGKKTGEEKKKFLEESNVLVFPTEYKLETFGRIILEGMMFGMPIIANGIATIPTIIEDRKTGFILRKNSPEEISDYLIKLTDEKLRVSMGNEGRKRFLKEYSLRDYKEEFFKIFK